MTIEKRKDIHTISLLVANKPGVLVRCAQVFARRGFNIDSLVVSATVNPQYSRMTITATGDPNTLEQIIKQTAKLIDVLHCSEHTGVDSVTQELALVKMQSSASNKALVKKLAKKYRLRVIDEQDKTIILEQAGTTQELDECEVLLKKNGIIEMVRSGKLVMALGRETT